MNYEKFYNWLEGYLEAFSVTEHNNRAVMGSAIMQKMKQMEQQQNLDFFGAMTPTLPDLPPYNTSENLRVPTGAENIPEINKPSPVDMAKAVDANDKLMGDFLDSYKDLPEEEIPVFGEVPIEAPTEWEVDDGKAEAIKSTERE